MQLLCIRRRNTVYVRRTTPCMRNDCARPQIVKVEAEGQWSRKKKKEKKKKETANQNNPAGFLAAGVSCWTRAFVPQ